MLPVQMVQSVAEVQSVESQAAVPAAADIAPRSAVNRAD